MDWLHPTYGWALGLVLVMAGLFGWAAWQRRQALGRFGDRGLVRRLATVRPRWRRANAVLVVLSAALLIVSLAGPRLGTTVRDVERQGVDLLIALDVSASMQAEDVAPNRLARAKNEAKQLLDRLSGDRVGLILFAGDAFIQCPLTTDYDAVRLFLDVAEPGLIPTPGTDFEIAFQTAMQAFEPPDRMQQTSDAPARPEAARTRALLYVSDGENHIGRVDDITRMARERGIVMFAAGVGEKEGTRIPVYENGQRTGFQRDRRGEIVHTRLEEEALTQLAAEGDYFRIARTASTLTNLPAVIDRLEQTSFGSERFEEYAEQYQWPLALGLLLLITASATRMRRATESP